MPGHDGAEYDPAMLITRSCASFTSAYAPQKNPETAIVIETAAGRRSGDADG